MGATPLHTIVQVIGSLLASAIKVGCIILLVYLLAIVLPARQDEGEELLELNMLTQVKPAFYFSILPQWYAKEWAFYPSSAIKKAGLGLAKQSVTFQEWEQIQSLISEISKSPGMSMVERARYVNDLGAMAAMLEEMRTSRDENVILNQLIDAVYSLQKKSQPIQIKDYMPRFIFWGKQNGFHDILFPSELHVNAVTQTSLLNALYFSLLLGSMSFVWIVLIGYFTTLRYVNSHRKVQDRWMVFLSWLYVIPIFGLAIVAVQIFTTDTYGTWWNWFPGVGQLLYLGNSMSIIGHMWYLFLPSWIIAIPMGAGLAIRWISNIEQYHETSLKTSLSAKGLPNQMIWKRHFMKLSSLPIVAYLAMLFPALISGSLMVENIFAIPGMGRMTLQGVVKQDIGLILSIVGVIAWISILFNKLLMWMNQWLDPRSIKKGI